MIVPNKVIRFSESIIGKMTYILDELSYGEISIEALYDKTQEYFEEIDEFIFSLDVLYILDSIEVDFKEGVVNYANRNKMR